MESQLSPIVRTTINLVQRLIIPGLIVDLWIMPLRPKTSEVDLPGVTPRTISLHTVLIALPLSYGSHRQSPLTPALM